MKKGEITKPTLQSKQRKMTAILEAGILKGKMKMPTHLPHIDIIVPVVGRFRFIEELTPELHTTPVMRFTWWKQTGRYTHVYKLQEIL